MKSQALALCALVPFCALTVAALVQHGYWGVLAPHFASLGGAQVFTDLVLALTLALIWMHGDARRLGRPYAPWLLLTLVLGSIGPLLYLATRRTPEEGASQA